MELTKRQRKLINKLKLLYNTQLSFQDIANIVGVNRSNIYRAFQKCLKLGFITEKRKPTELGLAYCLWGGRKTQQIRLHNLVFKLEIEKAEKTLYDRLEKVFKAKTWNLNTNINVKPYQFLLARVEQGEIWCRIMNRTLLIYFPEIIAESPEKAKECVISILKDILPKIERNLKIKLKAGLYMPITIGSQHIALMNNEIAKAFLEANIKFIIEDEQGNVRLIVDDSKKLEELEAINYIYAEEDARKIKDFMADLVINNSYYKMKKDIEEIKLLLNEIFQKKTKLEEPKYIG